MKPAIKYDNYTPKYNPDEIVTGSFKAGFGFVVGVTIHTFNELYHKFNIAILSREKLGGFLVRDYKIKIKGKHGDIRKLMCYLDDF